MVQDLADHVGLGNEGNDAHVAAAILANQRVGFEHTTDKVRPSSPKVSTLGFVELVVLVVGTFRAEMFSSSSGIPSVVQDGMLVGLGIVRIRAPSKESDVAGLLRRAAHRKNVDEHASEKLERLEEPEFSVFGSGLIDNVVALVVVVESLKRDGASNDVAAECFEPLGIGGIEIDIIVDAKAAAAPRTEELDAFVGEKVVFL